MRPPWGMALHAKFVSGAGRDGYVHDLSLDAKFQTWFNNNLTSSATAIVPIPGSALAIYVGPAW